MKYVLNPSTDYIVVHVHSYVYLFIYVFCAGRLEDAEIFFKYQGGGGA